MFAKNIESPSWTWRKIDIFYLHSHLRKEVLWSLCFQSLKVKYPDHLFLNLLASRHASTVSNWKHSQSLMLSWEECISIYIDVKSKYIHTQQYPRVVFLREYFPLSYSPSMHIKLWVWMQVVVNHSNSQF